MNAYEAEIASRVAGDHKGVVYGIWGRCTSQIFFWIYK